MSTPLLVHDTALVTGAGAGIGRAIAEALLREGARVLLTDIDADRGQAATAALDASGRQSSFVAGDLSDPKVPKKLFDAALERLGRISIFVHCASPNHKGATLFTATEEAWEQMFAVNIFACFQLGRLLGQHMRDNGIKGRMLFITSLHAETPRKVPHYSAAKSGLTMLMKEMARELGPSGIRVNAIAPGMISAKWSALAASYANWGALHRIGKPEEVAEMAIALLSDRFSGYVTGTTVVVDGGLSLSNWIPDSD